MLYPIADISIQIGVNVSNDAVQYSMESATTRHDKRTSANRNNVRIIQWYLIHQGVADKSLSFISPFRNLSFLYLGRGLFISCKGIGV